MSLIAFIILIVFTAECSGYLQKITSPLSLQPYTFTNREWRNELNHLLMKGYLKRACGVGHTHIYNTYDGFSSDENSKNYIPTASIKKRNGVTLDNRNSLPYAVFYIRDKQAVDIIN